VRSQAAHQGRAQIGDALGYRLAPIVN